MQKIHKFEGKTKFKDTIRIDEYVLHIIVFTTDKLLGERVSSHKVNPM